MRNKEQRRQRDRLKVQEAVLYSLEYHREWWHGCGWHWNTPTGTKQVLDTLVERGLVEKTDDPKAPYKGVIYKPAQSATRPACLPVGHAAS